MGLAWYSGMTNNPTNTNHRGGHVANPANYTPSHCEACRDWACDRCPVGIAWLRRNPRPVEDYEAKRRHLLRVR